MNETIETSQPGRARVLVVEDAPEFLRLICDVLRRDGYDVIEAADGAGALNALEPPVDLVVLDLSLPDLDGVEVCRQIRDRTPAALVLMLSARDEEVDKIIGLKSGADDYMTKPFSPRELAARVEALLRRSPGRSSAWASGAPPAPAEHQVGDLILRPDAREVECGRVRVELTRIEFEILEALVERPRMVFSRSVLRERVWGEDWYGDDHVVDVHVANLRKKINRGRDVSRIRTVRGVGYRMETDDTRRE